METTSGTRTLSRGSRAIGTWLKIASTEPVEIMARAGFDFVVIDMEHSPITTETALRLIALADLAGLSPFVRVPDHDPSVIQKVLDMGAHGLFVPRIDSFEQAESAVKAFHFPPVGIRGAGSTSRAGLWGALTVPEYLTRGRDDAALIVQLESMQAIEDVEKIAALTHVHGLFVGSADLSLSIGAQVSDPRVVAATDRARKAAHEAGKVFGLAYGAQPSAVAEGFVAGNDFALAANDAGLLTAAAADIRQSIKDQTLRQVEVIEKEDP